MKLFFIQLICIIGLGIIIYLFLRPIEEYFSQKYIQSKKEIGYIFIFLSFAAATWFVFH